MPVRVGESVPKELCPYMIPANITEINAGKENHAIAEVSPNYTVRMDSVKVFDAYMGYMNNGRVTALADLSFYWINNSKVNKALELGTYRGEAIKDRAGAIITSFNESFARVDE